MRQVEGNVARQDTEQALEAAALALLREHGVLAGLNLRAAADAAGVNRGNVYHYFGSRRQLLQSALKRRLAASRETIQHQHHSSLAERMRWAFRYMIELRDPIELAALLVLDGDMDVEIMSFRPETTAALEELQQVGELDRDVDLVAFEAFLAAVLRGYVLHRSHLAREAGVNTTDLDQRLEAFLVRLVECIQPNATHR
jgi:AcrR family transcriptional regulator